MLFHELFFTLMLILYCFNDNLSINVLFDPSSDV